MRSVWALASVGLAACSLVTSLGGLGGADASAPDAGTDAATDVAQDMTAVDAGIDADAAEASCGFAGPTTGLVAYYPFEEGQGDVVHDCSPNHFDGTFVQQASWAAGKKGDGIFVQATSGCVDFGVHPELEPLALSVSVWMNVTSFPAVGASGYVVGESFNADVDGWRFGSRVTDAGDLLGWEHGPGTEVDVPAPVPGAWHQVVVTFASGTLQLFLDGASVETASGLPPITYDGASLRVGCRADGANAFNGYLDEVRLYDRVLSASEIVSLAQ